MNFLWKLEVKFTKYIIQWTGFAADLMQSQQNGKNKRLWITLDFPENTKKL